MSPLYMYLLFLGAAISLSPMIIKAIKKNKE